MQEEFRQMTLMIDFPLLHPTCGFKGGEAKADD